VSPVRRSPTAAAPVVGPEELPVVQAARLELRDAEHSWLVRELWSQGAVGFIAGAPKLGKSWLGLDLAVSVASGTPCLGHFAVDAPGPALIYLAEDALPLVRDRLVSLCANRGLALDSIDLHVITAPSLRLDLPADRERLAATLARRRPRLLVLDPLVRLHALDENSAAEVSEMLGFLRALSREHAVALVVVHHMSKKGRPQLGQALRGSSDLHAWADDSLYLTRTKTTLLLTLEHRSAPAADPVPIALLSRADGSATHLEIAGSATGGSAEPTPVRSLRSEIQRTLAASAAPVPRVALRKQLRVNNQQLGRALEDLECTGQIHRTPTGWTLRLAARTEPAPASSQPPEAAASAARLSPGDQPRLL
jgi:hypothetical protein